MPNNFVPVIGLEVHIELRTKTKMFCGCFADHFGKTPNIQVCPVCLGLPGALPVPNGIAIEWTQKLGAALQCKLMPSSRFDRKHYFYPDLPKGFQISQFEGPLVGYGEWEMENGDKVRIRRIHLEEDTGKLIHQTKDGKRVSLIDFNRSGVPLVELVTEPDFTSANQAKEFLQELQQIIRYLEISDVDMEKGSMRLEANISLQEQKSKIKNQKLPDYRVEIKNINSFRFLEQAINYEIKRQTEVLSKEGELSQETRGYDEKSGTTKLQRSKEYVQDYRYFPEPDIPELLFNQEELDKLKENLPELPKEKRKRFVGEYKIPENYSIILTQSKDLADYFEEAVTVGKKHQIASKKIADVLLNKKPNIQEILPGKLVEILRNESEKVILPLVELEEVVLQVIKENSEAVESYKKGKENALQFLVGKVISKTKGQVNSKDVLESLKEKLNA